MWAVCFCIFIEKTNGAEKNGTHDTPHTAASFSPLRPHLYILHGLRLGKVSTTQWQCEYNPRIERDRGVNQNTIDRTIEVLWGFK